MKTTHDTAEREKLFADIKKILTDMGYQAAPDQDPRRPPAIHYYLFEKDIRVRAATINLADDNLPTKQSFVALFTYNGGKKISCTRCDPAELFVKHFANAPPPVISKRLSRVREITNG